MRLIILASFAMASAAPIRDWTGYSFDQYQADFKKTYAENEVQGLRQSLFETRLNEVQAQNSEYSAGRSAWYAEINDFSDWTEQELSKLKKGRPNVVNEFSHPVSSPLRSTANPDKFDWREKNVATKVKNQGGCGSCWAFGSTEVLESHYAIATGNWLCLHRRHM